MIWTESIFHIFLSQFMGINFKRRQMMNKCSMLGQGGTPVFGWVCKCVKSLKIAETYLFPTFIPTEQRVMCRNASMRSPLLHMRIVYLAKRSLGNTEHYDHSHNHSSDDQQSQNPTNSISPCRIFIWTVRCRRVIVPREDEDKKYTWNTRKQIRLLPDVQV